MKEVDPLELECFVCPSDAATFSVDVDGDLDIGFYEHSERVSSVILRREHAEELHAWLSEVLEKPKC